MAASGQERNSGRDRRPILDRRDVELKHLRKERDELLVRERRARAEAETAQRRLSELTSVSKRFAASIRSTSVERQRSRRRLAVQLAVGRVLADAGGLEEAAPRFLEAFGEGLGWKAGVLWMVDRKAGVLRRHSVWRAPGRTPGQTPGRTPGQKLGEEDQKTLPCGAGLPGRVWEEGEAVRTGAVLHEGGSPREAIAFPIRDGGRMLGVAEFSGIGDAPGDEDLLRTVTLVGQQLGQYIERRRAEEDAERLLVRERAARAEAEAARNRTAGILESISDAFFALDRDMRFTYVNREAERVWESRREELLGRSLKEVFPQAPGSESYGAVERALEERTPVRFEALSPVTDRWISGAAYPAASGASVYFRDITDQKKAQEALRESEERLQLALGATQTGTFAWDPAADHTEADERTLAIFGLPPGTEITRAFALGRFRHPEDRAAVEAAIEAALDPAGDGRYEASFRIYPGGEERWVEQYGRMYFEGRQRRPVRMVGTIRDVTERKRVEEERALYLRREREAREAAEAAQERLAFSAGAADERRRISRELHDRVAHWIAVVHQSLELREALKTRDAARAEAKISQARELAKSALDSTRDLSMALRASEVEEGLGPALSKLLETTVPPGVDYAVSVEGEESLIPAPVRDQLFLVLREAVRNAASHSGCGKIAVELDIAPERVTGRIEDDGRGFDPEMARRDGTGGIRSMQERAALVGGTFDLWSGTDGSTRVEVYVPLEEKAR